MAPIGPSPVSSGEQIHHVSRSISASFPPIPITVQERGIPDAVYIAIHENTPFIPRTIQRISTLLSRASSPITTSVSSQKRQTQILAIPTTYAGLNDGPAPGSVAGIVIGSVCGFLLILWLLYTCFNMGGLGGGVGEIVEEEIVRHRSRSPRRDRSRSETIEISKSRSPPQPRERIIMEETRRVSRPPDPEPEETIDDIVEVIEEQSISPPPPSRRPSKRTSGGYRTVDPADFGGGRRSMRHVR